MNLSERFPPEERRELFSNEAPPPCDDVSEPIQRAQSFSSHETVQGEEGWLSHRNWTRSFGSLCLEVKASLRFSNIKPLEFAGSQSLDSDTPVTYGKKTANLLLSVQWQHITIDCFLTNLEVPSCKFQKEVGVCAAYIPSYYYNLETMSCKKFIYGGCQGNCNRYSSYKECMKACHGCKLQKEEGVCKAYFVSYYYNLETHGCKIFIYGGCQGNCNRYDSYKNCMKACHG
uniref:BPTI/Kunitz inhibitor domain-containing protein n=1 Tax=Timema poppense TaxID=170557 RepID=A0A7R9CIY2_TIMPO|nr:unnamed protein product [Timema poppensis]